MHHDEIVFIYLGSRFWLETWPKHKRGKADCGWVGLIILICLSPCHLALISGHSFVSKQNSGPSTFTVTLSFLPPLSLSLTGVIILVIMLTQKIKQLLKSKVPSFYFPDKEINVLPWSQTFISIQNFWLLFNFDNLFVSSLLVDSGFHALSKTQFDDNNF